MPPEDEPVGFWLVGRDIEPKHTNVSREQAVALVNLFLDAYDMTVDVSDDPLYRVTFHDGTSVDVRASGAYKAIYAASAAASQSPYDAASSVKQDSPTFSVS